MCRAPSINLFCFSLAILASSLVPAQAEPEAIEGIKAIPHFESEWIPFLIQDPEVLLSGAAITTLTIFLVSSWGLRRWRGFREGFQTWRVPRARASYRERLLARRTREIFRSLPTLPKTSVRLAVFSEIIDQSFDFLSSQQQEELIIHLYKLSIDYQKLGRPQDRRATRWLRKFKKNHSDLFKTWIFATQQASRSDQGSPLASAMGLRKSSVNEDPLSGISLRDSGRAIVCREQLRFFGLKSQEK